MENPYTDRLFLTRQFYASNDDLAVRTHIHDTYTEPRVNFMSWVLDRIPWRGDETVLDAGCGAGAYLSPTASRLSAGGLLLGGDISRGLLRGIAERTSGDHPPLTQLDIQHLPFADERFDVVLANHMLYHVPDIPEALEQIHRILRVGGVLLASTNAARSQVGFRDLIIDACEHLGMDFLIESSPAGQRFSLEEGKLILAEYFSEVEMQALDSALVFREVEPPLAYIHSMRHFYRSILPEDCDWTQMLERVKEKLAEIINAEGEFRVLKRSGVFIARKSSR